MKNIFFITGATGFIGANIIRTLVKNGERVCVMSRNKALNWRLADIAFRIEVYESDILNPSLEEILKKVQPDFIFHLASYGVLPNENDVEKMIDINIKGTMNLIKAAKKIPFKLFINTGTCVEYGVKEYKMKESDVLEPINDYGITKAAATLHCQKEGARNNLPIITFRLFTPFGYYEDRNRLIPSVILNVMRNEPIKVSVPSIVRDFIFIEDVVGAYMKALKTTFISGDIINIGSGKQHTISDIVNKIIAISKSNSPVEWGAIKQQARYIEPKKWEADIKRAKTALGFEAKNSLDSGLEKTINWFRKNPQLY